jgi:hypothetical protein
VPPGHYQTSDYYLASFLICCGAALVSFTRVSRRRFVFCFVTDVRLHQLLRLWWSDTPVPLVPSGIFASLRGLKSMVRGRPLYIPRECPPPPASPASPADHAEQ